MPDTEPILKPTILARFNYDGNDWIVVTFDDKKEPEVMVDINYLWKAYPYGDRSMQTPADVYDTKSNTYYAPFVTEDGRVGYRVGKAVLADPRETFVYMVPSTDSDDGVPTVFIYEGGDDNPDFDGAVSHVVLEHMIGSKHDLHAIGNDVNTLREIAIDLIHKADVNALQFFLRRQGVAAE